MRRLAFVIAAAMVPAALLALLLIGYDYYERERTQLETLLSDALRVFMTQSPRHAAWMQAAQGLGAASAIPAGLPAAPRAYDSSGQSPSGSSTEASSSRGR